MSCSNPKYVKFQKYTKIDEKTGEIYETKRPIFLKANDEITEETRAIPCGKCEQCRIEKANDWATRAYLESQKWPKNAFLTLTYNEENLPDKKTLIKADLQKFWKRLRKHLGNQKISYLACGEIGLLTGRPHYHAAVFNYWPEDAKYYKKNELKEMLYTSKTLEQIWGKGYVIIGQLTYESAAYIARYVFKKSYGAKTAPEEFIVSSKRPAIAKNYYFDKKQWEQIQRNNGIWVQTKKGAKLKKIPRYLLDQFKKNERTAYNEYTEKNQEKAIKNRKTILAETDKNFGRYDKIKTNNKKKALQILDNIRTKGL